MKTKEILALLKQGVKPVVLIQDSLWDDSWGDKGMIARIVAVKEKEEDMVALEFDYNEFKEHNLALQSHGYYLKMDHAKTGTAFEAGMMEIDDIREEVYFMLDGNGSDVPVEIDQSPLLAEFIRSKSEASYVAWLEDQLTSTREAVKNIMDNR